MVSCTDFRNWRRLSRSVGAIPSKRTRTPFAGALRVTTPLRANPFTQIFPLGTQRPTSTFAPGLTGVAVSIRHPPALVLERVAPDRGWRLIDMKFYSDEALNPRVPSPVASPICAKQIGLKWRGRRRWCRNRLWNRFFLRAGRRLSGTRFNLPHSRQKGFFPLLHRSFAIGL